MVPVLTSIAAGAPDGIFFPIFPEEGAHIVRQMGGVAGLEGVTLIAGAGPARLRVPRHTGDGGHLLRRS